jgi:hypothetical protein
MKKLLLAALVPAAISLSALNITTNDGKTYKNVSISSITPVGFDISYTDKNGDMLMRGLYFKDLPEKTRKKFGYKPKQAVAFEKKTLIYRKQLIEKRLKAVREKDLLAKNYEHVRAMVYARRMADIKLTVFRETHGGVIADVSSQYPTLTTGHYGRVFVYGVHGQWGVTWMGCIYPTGSWVNLSDGKYPAFSTSLDMAVISVSHHIHNQVKASKKKK